MKRIPFLFILFLFACGSNEEPTDEATEESAEENTEEIQTEGMTVEDSTMIQGVIDGLTKIEKFAVGDNYDLLLAILKHNESEDLEAVETALSKRTDDYFNNYNIDELDSKNGYIHFTPTAAEVTYTMTYWNLEDGSQLIAQEEWGCGPVCSSGLQFWKYKDNERISLENKDVIPEIDDLPSWIIPDYDPNGEEPYEFRYILPREGKDIHFEYNGSFINLVLEGEQFKGY